MLLAEMSEKKEDKRKWGDKDGTEKDGIEKEEGTGYNDKQRESVTGKGKNDRGEKKGSDCFLLK